MNISQLGETAVAAANKGESVIEWGSGHWVSFPRGGKPERAYWGTTIAKHQRARVETDKVNVGRLAVGESLQVVKGYHPRHGEATVLITRVA